MTDHLPSSKDTPSRNIESAPKPHESIDALFGMLIDELDPSITAELREARTAILALLSEVSVDPARREETWTEYARIGESIEGQLDPSADGITSRARAYIALALHKALIFRDAGRIGRCIEELDMAHTYARDDQFDSIASAIQAELDDLVNSSELTPEGLLVKLKGEISELHREDLRDQLARGDTLEAILSEAYNVLIDEGENPDEVFGQLGLVRP